MENPLNKTVVISTSTTPWYEVPVLKNVVKRKEYKIINSIVTFVFTIAFSILLLVISGYKLSDHIVNDLKNGDPFLIAPIRSLETTNTLKAVYYTDVQSKKLIALTNEYRAKQGLPYLKTSSELSNSASAHAKDMFSRYYFSHTDPDGKTPFDRLNSTKWSEVGENILLQDFSMELTPEQVLEQWINSPPHLETLQNKEWTHVGVGFKQGIRFNPKTNKKEPIIIWVQIFTKEKTN